MSEGGLSPHTLYSSLDEVPVVERRPRERAKLEVQVQFLAGAIEGLVSVMEARHPVEVLERVRFPYEAVELDGLAPSVRGGRLLNGWAFDAPCRFESCSIRVGEMSDE